MSSSHENGHLTHGHSADGRRPLAEIFGTEKPLIAMVHLPPLPGTPLYDATRGVGGLIDAVSRDLEVLLDAGFDGFLFCNEGDRPYELRAGLESAAVMARVVSACAPAERPYGVDFLWDARCALAVAVATEARFMREVLTGVWESDMGLWQTDAAATLRERRRLEAQELAIFMNVTPEFASPIGSRTPAQSARSIAVSSLADAILVSGPMAGAEPGRALIEEVREAVPAHVPVLLNTGARAQTIADYLIVADGCIVGSDLKVDGYTWNPVDPERAKRFLDAARQGSAA
ncbi:MAG: BtpA/SgcQ family protein [Solirubrobacteraceae bacterium]